MSRLRVPESIEEEHRELMEALVNESVGTGRGASAVKALLTKLQPHFEKENRIVTPLLGLMEPLAERRKVGERARIGNLGVQCEAEYEVMFEEHKGIRQALMAAEKVAKSEGNDNLVRVLGALAHHAKVEEEVLYPAALLASRVAAQQEACVA